MGLELLQNWNQCKTNTARKCDVIDRKRVQGDQESFCPHSLFHGQSAEMEGENAFQIFKRSRDYGFEYRTYISDGDNKVWSRVAGIYEPMKDRQNNPILDDDNKPVGNHTENRMQ